MNLPRILSLGGLSRVALLSASFALAQPSGLHAAAAAGPAPAKARELKILPVDSALPDYVPGPTLKGELHLVGGGGIDDEVEALAGLWARLFESYYPLVKVRMDITTSGSTPAIMVEDAADVGIMTRDIFPA